MNLVMFKVCNEGGVYVMTLWLINSNNVKQVSYFHVSSDIESRGLLAVFGADY